jgi:hypothetical protein
VERGAWRAFADSRPNGVLDPHHLPPIPDRGIAVETSRGLVLLGPHYRRIGLLRGFSFRPVFDAWESSAWLYRLDPAGDRLIRTSVAPASNGPFRRCDGTPRFRACSGMAATRLVEVRPHRRERLIAGPFPGNAGWWADVDPSPDGRWLLATLSSPHGPGDRSRVFLVPTAGGTPGDIAWETGPVDRCFTPRRRLAARRARTDGADAALPRPGARAVRGHASGP